MDPKFVNRCTFNKSNLLEMVKFNRRWLRILVYVCSAIILLSAAFEFILADDVTQGSLWLALGLFFLVYTLLLPRISAKTMLKRYDTLYHAQIVSELQFFEDRIATSSEQTHAQTTILYPQIKRVIRTKNLYLLQLSAQLVLLVDRAGFVSGSGEAFEPFIRQKATSARFVFPRRTRG